MKRPTLAHLNDTLAAGHRRAEELEGVLERVLEPILHRAGEQAARAFSGQATNHLTAAVAAGVVDPSELARAMRPALSKAALRDAVGIPEREDARRDADRTALASLIAASPLEQGVRAIARAVYRSLALTSAAGPTGRTMICVKPRPDEAAAIADPDGEPAENLHVTLVYLGELEGDLAELADVLRPVAANHAPLTGMVAGYGQFGTPDPESPPVGILLPDVPGLVELRVAVTEALQRGGFDYARNHGFEAHATVDYDPEPGELEEMLARAYGKPLHFDELLLVRDDTEVVPIPLVGVPPVTAAGEPPNWTAPAGAEVLDVAALVASLRTKTDPVRLEVIRSVMMPTLGALGLEWDVTNPFTARVLAQSGSQIVGIAETTQLNVMRIIAASYEEGLSIPDTAKAIRVGMADATKARARLIARTELVGATNGGSLAATQIVAAATGDKYTKIWMTAPGARHPRHEGYNGLDGQTAELDGYFDVGGAMLQHPGDPDGPPDEVCNCFPGETLVVAPGTQMGFRRRYDGWLHRVETDAGHVLAGTPNHPVLTDAGWKPLGDLVEGDRLVCGALREHEATVAPDVQHAPAAIEEVFGALARGGVARRIRGSAMQFHGDGTVEGEVEVVAADGALFDHDTASRLDPPLENVLVGGCEAAAALAPAGFRADLVVGDRLISASRVSGGSKGTTVVWTGLTHAYDHRGRAPAWLDPMLGQVATDDPAAHAIQAGERLLGSAFEVTLAEVVDVEVEPFHGDVFNLQTETGAYVAGGIVSHNCRCSMSYEGPDGGDVAIDE